MVVAVPASRVYTNYMTFLRESGEAVAQANEAMASAVVARVTFLARG